MRRISILFLFVLAACSRETPAPPATSSTAELKVTSTSTAPAPVAPATATSGTYADAMKWMASNPGFRFVLVEGTTRAEGEMKRERVGAESLRVTIDGVEWTAETKPNGVIWSRGGKESAPPPQGGRIFQRVTLTLDPQKREGEAQLAGTEGELNHWTFTNNVTGEPHHLWVSTRDGHIARMKIESKDAPVEMTITP
jgi:hypothetical protein